MMMKIIHEAKECCYTLFADELLKEYEQFQKEKQEYNNSLVKSISFNIISKKQSYDETVFSWGMDCVEKDNYDISIQYYTIVEVSFSSSLLPSKISSPFKARVDGVKMIDSEKINERILNHILRNLDYRNTILYTTPEKFKVAENIIYLRNKIKEYEEMSQKAKDCFETEGDEYYNCFISACKELPRQLEKIVPIKVIKNEIDLPSHLENRGEMRLLEKLRKR